MFGALLDEDSPDGALALDGEHRLALAGERARHVLGRRRVVDEDLEARAERQLLEPQLGAHEGEGADLAGEIQPRHQRTSTSAGAVSATGSTGRPRPRRGASARKICGG